MFVQLVKLRRDHVLTVGLRRIIGIVFLMIVFSFVEFTERFQCRNNGLAKGF